MQHYHLEFEGIPEYINMLKDAHKLKVVVLNIVVQRQEAKGVLSGAPCLQVCEQILGVDLRVNSVGVP